MEHECVCICVCLRYRKNDSNRLRKKIFSTHRETNMCQGFASFEDLDFLLEKEAFGPPNEFFINPIEIVIYSTECR